MIESFDEIIYIHFVSIYGDKMKFDPGMVPVYEKMIINYFKLIESGEKVFISKSNKGTAN